MSAAGKFVEDHPWMTFFLASSAIGAIRALVDRGSTSPPIYSPPAPPPERRLDWGDYDPFKYGTAPQDLPSVFQPPDIQGQWQIPGTGLTLSTRPSVPQSATEQIAEWMRHNPLLTLGGAFLLVYMVKK